MSVRSFTPPLAAYSATWVLPTSITSGASLLARALVTFWPMPSHSWIWMSRVTPWCAASKSRSKVPSRVSDMLSRMIQTVSAVAAEASGVVLSVDEEPHAVSPAASARTAAAARNRGAIGFSQWSDIGKQSACWR